MALKKKNNCTRESQNQLEYPANFRNALAMEQGSRSSFILLIIMSKTIKWRKRIVSVVDDSLEDDGDHEDES
jgi:hypothetical protein